MSYYHSCSPYDVQKRNGGRFTFETIAKRYEDTKPLRGKRKDQNIRPIGQRDRAWERMIKVSDTEYYVSYDCYQYRNHHNKAITWKQEGGMDYLIIHTPKSVWSSSDPNGLYPRQLSSSSNYWFYDFNMPQEFSMANYRSNKYVRHNDQYYTIEKGDITFQRKIGSSPTDWQPLVVHREFKHTLDRKQTKELRKMVDIFLPYYDVMCDIVEEKRSWHNRISRAIHDGEHGAVSPEQALELFKPRQDGSVPQEWIRMVEYYKSEIHQYDYDWKTQTRTDTFERHKLKEKVARDLFAIVRPCKTEPVKLGAYTNDRYKGWFK